MTWPGRAGRSEGPLSLPGVHLQGGAALGFQGVAEPVATRTDGQSVATALPCKDAGTSGGCRLSGSGTCLFQHFSSLPRSLPSFFVCGLSDLHEWKPIT